MYLSENVIKSSKFLLNQNISWKNLPWRRIHIRVIMIAKHIFIASKKHNLQFVYKLQNYILNSNEAKIFLLSKFLSQFTSNKCNYTKAKYSISSLDKFEILQFLSVKNIQLSLTKANIIEQIKQHLVYLSIKPAWQARLAKCSDRFIHKLLSNTLTNTNLLYNHLLIRDVIKKLKSYNYISKSIANWLYKTQCLNYKTLHNLNYTQCLSNNEKQNSWDTNLSINIVSLSMLISQIMLNDLCWYTFIIIKKNNEYLKNSQKNVDFFLSCNYFKDYFTFSSNSISFFYSKKKLINYKFACLSQIRKALLSTIFKSYIESYFDVKNFVSIHDIKKQNQLVNNFLYSLVRKYAKISKSTFYTLMNRLNNNELVNKLILMVNFDKFYEFFIFYSDLNYYTIYF